MSKEANSKDSLDAVTAETGRRRRRRRGGLRVPSDNVPRRGGTLAEAAAAPPAPAAPDDPQLAMSVAFGLSDGDSADTGAQHAPDDSGDPPTGGVDAAAVDPSASRSDDAPGPPNEADPPDAPDLPELPELDDELVDDIDGAATVVAPPPDLMPEAAAAAQAAPASTPELEAAADSAPQKGRGGTSVPLDGLVDDGDSVDIHFGDSVDIAFEEDDSLRAPPRRHTRAQTEALSDSDLEELIEPMDEDADPNAPVSAPGLPAIPDSHERAAAGSGDSRSADSSAAVSAAPKTPADESAKESGDARDGGAAAGDAEAPDPKKEEADEEEFDGLATVQYVPGKDAKQAVPGGESASSFSPSDSGELLSDDMIEEIDDGAAPRAASEPGNAAGPNRTAAKAAEGDAAPADSHGAKRTSSPPPAAAQAEADSSEARAGEASASPPPVPSPPKKPPPAPAPAAAAAPTPVPRPRRQGKPWFEEIFDEDYLRTLPFLTPQSTQFEANFVIDSLAVDAGGQVLDVGCGYGRHAMELAARGYHVVGLDLSLPLLLRGADEAQRRGLTINFVHGDMRDLAFDSQFDGAYCLFSTFGYFDDEVNRKTAQNIARALKPGARFVLEVLNRDYLIEDLPARVWWEGDGCVVLEELDFNYFSSRIISNRSVVFDDGRQVEQEISVRAYSLHELGKLLHAAGFRVLEISGSMTTRGRFFGAKARGIIVVAERRPADFAGEGTRPG